MQKRRTCLPRRKLDFYETPPHYLKALASVLEIPDGSCVIDPCVGDGAIAEFIRERYSGIEELWTNDIDPTREADSHLDARRCGLYDDGYSWWITNPPFNIIDEILRTALECVPNVVTLARLSVLEPTEARRTIYKVIQPNMLIVLPRYCFRLNDKGKRATDSVTCCWVGWGPDVPKVTTVWTEPPPEGV